MVHRCRQSHPLEDKGCRDFHLCEAKERSIPITRRSFAPELAGRRRVLGRWLEGGYRSWGGRRCASPATPRPCPISPQSAAAPPTAATESGPPLGDRA